MAAASSRDEESAVLFDGLLFEPRTQEEIQSQTDSHSQLSNQPSLADSEMSLYPMSQPMPPFGTSGAAGEADEEASLAPPKTTLIVDVAQLKSTLLATQKKCQQLDKLSKDLRAKNAMLKQNLSCVFQTAVDEIKRKDMQIKQLQENERAARLRQDHYQRDYAQQQERDRRSQKHSSDRKREKPDEAMAVTSQLRTQMLSSASSSLPQLNVAKQSPLGHPGGTQGSSGSTRNSYPGQHARLSSDSRSTAAADERVAPSSSSSSRGQDSGRAAQRQRTT